MNRGMTLFEVLLALALLAALVVAITSWTTMAATFGVRLENTLVRESSAEAFLRLVHDDIVVGYVASDKESEEPRVLIDDADGALLIPARVKGSTVEHRYEFDAHKSRITLHERTNQGQPRQSRIVGDVAQVEWVFDNELGTLTATITMNDGSSASRRYVLP